MIIATAGHVDHGKTALVHQLTGVDTDRLDEEKRRGLSISLGYAYLPREGGLPLGFIDVPGHRRFINNMISGISGIDLGMLVVAADDGPMPQTLEHLDVLQLLGVQDLVAVISKCDRVEPGRVDAVGAELAGLLSARGWNEVTRFAVSNRTGEGVEALRDHLLARAASAGARAANGIFHLSIDRAFNLKGAGLVVTGTVGAGRVAVGDTLLLQPAGGELRVRGLHVHDCEAALAVTGQRCALNLGGGPEADAIDRGDWLTGPEAGPPSGCVDVNVALLPHAPFALKRLAPVKVYLGARRVAARLLPLEGGQHIQPGMRCRARLRLESAIGCFRGQRFLLRDHAEEFVLGGGEIIDPFAPTDGKADGAQLARLDSLSATTPEASLTRLLDGGEVIDQERFRQTWNLPAAALAERVPASARRFRGEDREWLVDRGRWNSAAERVRQFLQDFHDAHPDEPGVRPGALVAALERDMPQLLLANVLSALVREKAAELADGVVRLRGFRAAVSDADQGIWEVLRNSLATAGWQIPLLSEISADTGVDVAELERIARRAVKDGELHRVSERRFALPGQLGELADTLAELAGTGDDITVRTVKARWQTGRNLTVEVLEYFDSVRFTRRVGNMRLVDDPRLSQRLFAG